MLWQRIAILTIIAVAFVSDSLAQQRPSESLTPEQLTFFESKIRPVLVKECYGCHSNKSGNVRGGLRLDSRELTLLGGSSGPAVVPGDLEESLLYGAIRHEGFEMPPRRKLPDAVIEDFRRWIEMGAPDPRTSQIETVRSTITEQDIEQARETFWAYQPPRSPALPDVDDEKWIEGDVDRFILAKLNDAGIQPSADAPAHVVLRRLCFDLVGLPPTPDQIAFFEAKWREDPRVAIAHVVDRLLDTPQFGERWGRHWLDVVRFAESTGREVNMTFPHAWRYRDYVIDSFNEDKPFDEFVQEQIAGDLLPVESDEQWASHLVATSFLAIGPKNVNEANRVQFAADLVDEQIDATTRVFLGMSVACARCHDHKFDAIPQSDYYALAGIFANLTTYFGNPPSEFGAFSSPQQRRTSSLLLLPIDDPNPFDKRYSNDELSALREEITALLDRAAQMRRSGNRTTSQRERIRISNELAALSAKLAVVDAQGNPRSYCMGVQENAPPRNVRLLVRGEIDQPAQIVPRGFPQVLVDAPVPIDSNSSGRLALARWIGSDENPLTARVMVNRIWQHLLGQGIVTTTENFGVTGQSPSHPELLDYLAVEFADSGWSVKAMVRKIATSHVYRQGSHFNESYHHYDPDNALLWRANPRRLDSEAIRDAILSVSGQLDVKRPRGSEVAKAGYTRVRDGVLGDPRELIQQARQEIEQRVRQQYQDHVQRLPIRPFDRMRQRGSLGTGAPRSRFDRSSFQQMAMQSAQAIADKITHALDMEDATFRSVYLPIVRDHEPRSLVVFDLADSNTVTGTRETSNTANQALYMLNNRFVIEQSEQFAKRLGRSTRSIDEQIELAFMLAYARKPTDEERRVIAGFARDYRSSADRNHGDTDVLSAICQSLFASAEFRYLN